MVRVRVRTAYDAIAPAFAEVNAAMPPELSQAGEQLLGHLHPSDRLLDAGCGAGRDMAWFEARGISVVGLDLSTGMLNEARRRVRAPLIQGDLCALPFADAAFRAVWSTASLLHLPKAGAPVALREFRRVLTPDGFLVLSLQAGAGEVWEPYPHGAGGQRFMARYTAAEIDSFLTTAGFTPIAMTSSTSGIRHWLLFLASVAEGSNSPAVAT